MEAIGRLAGGIAHDFNTLLGVILGHSELLADSETPGSAVQKRAREIHKAAKSGAALTQQLLALGRREITQPVVLDINRIIREAETLLRRVIPEDIRIVLELQHDLWNVKADPNQIVQILLNLSTNARDAMPNGGAFRIETVNLPSDSRFTQAPRDGLKGDGVVVRVADTGLGMDKETQSRIFEPFFTTKPVGKGNGLGLATVYGIVQQNEGRISVSSQPGDGTTFEIYFPRAKEAGEQDPRAKSAAPIQRGHETVLVVEDSEDLREIVREFLEASGYRVVEASTSAEALEAVGRQESEIQLVLTDVVLRGESGRAIAEQLRTMKPELPVLFMSGYNDDTVMKHRVRHSDVNFLQKPFTRADLVAKVRASLAAAQAIATRTTAV
jgi:CheY-like chemotaxis protein